MDTILYASKSRFIIHIIYIAHIVSIVCIVLSDCISILLHILFAGIFVWCVLPDIYIYFYIFVSIYTEVYRISEKCIFVLKIFVLYITFLKYVISYIWCGGHVIWCGGQVIWCDVIALMQCDVMVMSCFMLRPAVGWNVIKHWVHFRFGRFGDELLFATPTCTECAFWLKTKMDL